VALLYILLVVGVGLTYSKNQSIPRPPTTEKPPGTKPAERPALGNEAAVSPIPGTSTIAPSITGRDPRASTGFIAFVSQRGRRREIFCMKPDGSCLRSLTNRLSSAFAFTWSPDGTKLLFRGGGVGDIYVVDRDGSNLRKILDLGEIVPDFPGVQSFQLDVQGTWLPDSRTIAVCAGSWPSSSNVYLIEVASLTRTTLCLAKAAWNPVWSPDGTRIAFKTFSSAGQQIRLADAKGARQVPVCAECDLQAGPLWLPDGKRFIFIKRGAWSQGKRNNKLCTKNVHDGEFTEADFSWDVTRGMAASPDGRKFAFSPEGDSRIHILHLAGNVWQPEATIENAGYPTWSPDGTSVAFVSSEDDQICLANVDGTGRVRIAPTPKDAASVGSKSSDGSDASAGDKQSPKWSPPQAPSDN
jgi:Tol biopolymer transport system component